MRRFNPDYWFNPEVSADHLSSPASVVVWAAAIDYCQWLNTREGVRKDQACYRRDGVNGTADRPPVADLSKTGYRLPTAAEFEYACRAGTSTQRYYGDDLTVSSSYALFGRIVKLLAVGSLMPNDLGLFDMNGNVAEWTCEFDAPDKVYVAGGGYLGFAETMTSWIHDATGPTLTYNSYGFRVVRTIELDDQGRPK